LTVFGGRGSTPEAAGVRLYPGLRDGLPRHDGRPARRIRAGL